MSARRWGWVSVSRPRVVIAEHSLGYCSLYLQCDMIMSRNLNQLRGNDSLGLLVLVDSIPPTIKQSCDSLDPTEMMFSFKLVATTIALFTFASASPALQARSCSPNFQGVPLTIFKTRLAFPFQWQPTNAAGGHIILTSTNTPFATSEFLVAKSGQPDGSYVFKLTADTAHALQMQGFANSDLSFQPIKFTGNTQNFLINCFSCGVNGDIADGCTVTHVQTGLCVTDNGSGSTLALTACTGAFNQQYNFHSP